MMRISREAERHAREGMWADVVVDEETGLNLILFGFGDGFHASYWGYDAEGAPACLVTETGLLSPE